MPGVSSPVLSPIGPVVGERGAGVGPDGEVGVGAFRDARLLLPAGGGRAAVVAGEDGGGRERHLRGDVQEREHEGSRDEEGGEEQTLGAPA